MPSASSKQHRFMSAVAHNPTFAKKAGVPQSVGKDFAAADKGKKFGRGGRAGINRQNTQHGKMDMPFKSLRRHAGFKGGGEMNRAKMGDRMKMMMQKRVRPAMRPAMAGGMPPGMKKGGMPMIDGKPAFMMKKKMMGGGMHKMPDGKMMKNSAMNMGGVAKYAKGGRTFGKLAALAGLGATAYALSKNKNTDEQAPAPVEERQIKDSPYTGAEETRGSEVTKDEEARGPEVTGSGRVAPAAAPTAKTATPVRTDVKPLRKASISADGMANGEARGPEVIAPAKIRDNTQTDPGPGPKADDKQEESSSIVPMVAGAGGTAAGVTAAALALKRGNFKPAVDIAKRFFSKTKPAAPVVDKAFEAAKTKAELRVAEKTANAKKRATASEDKQEARAAKRGTPFRPTSPINPTSDKAKEAMSRTTASAAKKESVLDKNLAANMEWGFKKGGTARYAKGGGIESRGKTKGTIIRMASGGSVHSASSRADGIAQRGRTKYRVY